MCSSLQTYSDAFNICVASGYVQNATFSSIATLSDTETNFDASCYCMCLNAFDKLQEIFEQQRLHSLF